MIKFASGTYNVKESEVVRDSLGRVQYGISCTVNFLDGSQEEFLLDRNCVGQELLDKVFEHLELIEKDYFGLQFADLVPGPDNVRWLEPKKSIRKQMQLPPYVLYFRVRFYVSDPSKLREEYTRYHFYLALRKDIVEGRLICCESLAALLASYAVQSEIGDYSAEENGETYLDNFQFIPNQSRSFLRKVIELHKLHSGQTPADAEYNFLDNAKRLEMYGVDLYQGRDVNQCIVHIGVASFGIAVFQNNRRINSFLWMQIVKISFKRKQFFLTLRSDKDESDVVVCFNLTSTRGAKQLWKSAIEHHTFFRLISPPAVQPKSFFTLGSHYRYSGRTEYQTLEEMKRKAKIERTFHRTGSKVSFASARSTVGPSNRDAILSSSKQLKSMEYGRIHGESVITAFPHSSAGAKGTVVDTMSNGTNFSMNDANFVPNDPSRSSFCGSRSRETTFGATIASTVQTSTVDEDVSTERSYDLKTNFITGAANGNAHTQTPSSTASHAQKTAFSAIDTHSLARTANCSVSSVPTTAINRDKVFTATDSPCSSVKPLTHNSRTVDSKNRCIAVRKVSPVSLTNGPQQRTQFVQSPVRQPLVRSNSLLPSQTLPLMDGYLSPQNGVPTPPTRGTFAQSSLMVTSSTNGFIGNNGPNEKHSSIASCSSSSKGFVSVPPKISANISNALNGNLHTSQPNSSFFINHQHTENSTEDGFVVIRMKPDQQGRFGFNIKGGADQGHPVIVSRVAPGSPADTCFPKLNEGDQVVLINNRDISAYAHDDVVNLIRSAREHGSRELVLFVKPNVYEVDDEKEEPDFRYVPETPHVAESVPRSDLLHQSLLLLADSLSAGAAVCQFEQLYRKKAGMSISVARLPENIHKNRYRDISPYDETRVLIKSGSSGDYINASYVNMEVPASGIVNRYIAAQGPLPHTTDDFWQVVWEQLCSTIVMLTTITERGRVKCHQYWPNLYESLDTESLHVVCNSECEESGFIIREFSVKSKQAQEERLVTQMSYIAWPDHGVPDDAAQFIDFVVQVRQSRIGTLEPMLVHCSAGIGRTGVLILMETAMCLIEANEPVYPLDLCRIMRNQRAMLIQTAVQYKFVCEAILEVYHKRIVKPMLEYSKRQI